MKGRRGGTPPLRASRRWPQPAVRSTELGDLYLISLTRRDDPRPIRRVLQPAAGQASEPSRRRARRRASRSYITGVGNSVKTLANRNPPMIVTTAAVEGAAKLPAFAAPTAPRWAATVGRDRSNRRLSCVPRSQWTFLSGSSPNARACAAGAISGSSRRKEKTLVRSRWPQLALAETRGWPMRFSHASCVTSARPTDSQFSARFDPLRARDAGERRASVATGRGSAFRCGSTRARLASAARPLHAPRLSPVPSSHDNGIGAAKRLSAGGCGGPVRPPLRGRFGLRLLPAYTPRVF
jgi:hypothetical protein